jgi:FkbM family methyltransferase
VHPLEFYLEKLYLRGRENRFWFLVYLLLRVPVTAFRLACEEGPAGAVRFLWARFAHLMRHRALAGSDAFYQQPVTPFVSRHGFRLEYVMDYVVYDEIFLVGAYRHPVWMADLDAAREPLVLDLGMHHGVFSNFIKSVRRDTRIVGAEISPVNFKKASGRLAVYPDVTVLSVGVANTRGRMTLHYNEQSTVNSIKTTDGKLQAEVELDTLDGFAARAGVAGREIVLMKMDIEGAEEELLLQLNGARETLARVRNFIVEIHDLSLAPAIHDTLAREFGLKLVHTHRLNCYYHRDGGAN